MGVANADLVVGEFGKSKVYILCARQIRDLELNWLYIRLFDDAIFASSMLNPAPVDPSVSFLLSMRDIIRSVFVALFPIFWLLW